MLQNENVVGNVHVVQLHEVKFRVISPHFSRGPSSLQDPVKKCDQKCHKFNYSVRLSIGRLALGSVSSTMGDEIRGVVKCIRILNYHDNGTIKGDAGDKYTANIRPF